MLSQKQRCLKLFPTHTTLWPRNSSTHELSSAAILFVHTEIHKWYTQLYVYIWCINMNWRYRKQCLAFRQKYSLDMSLQSQHLNINSKDHILLGCDPVTLGRYYKYLGESSSIL
jgi:hypothetical protein